MHKTKNANLSREVPVEGTNVESNRRTLDSLLAPLIFILIFFLLTRAPVDADLWWHLRAGEEMIAQKRVLLTDIFSYTRAGAAWVNAFWLSEIIIYGLYRFLGYFGLSAFVALTGALSFDIVRRRLAGNRLVNSFVLVLAALTAASVWGPRPQILSFLFVAWLDRFLSQSHAADSNGGRGRLWVLIPLFALWANIHGGWVWGFLLLFAQIAGMITGTALNPAREERALQWRAIKTLSIWSFFAALAVGVNPNGLGIWRLPFQQVGVSMQIQEWLSPDFHRVDFHPMLWMIFLLLFLAPFARADWSQTFKVVGFAYLTFVAQRNIAVFAIVAAPLLSLWLNRAAQVLLEGKRVRAAETTPRLATLINSFILILLGATALGKLILVSQPARVDENYPVEAVEWIKENRPNGNLFNSYNWGGYLLWNLRDYPVFIDGRADLYGDELIGQWHDVVSARQNATRILDQWNANVVLLEPHWQIIRVLENDGWEVAYRDEKSVVLIR
jgi:hypothetical protein